MQCFPEPVEIAALPMTRRLKNIRKLSFANYKLRVRRVSLCSTGTFDRGCYKSERHKALLNSGPAAERKRSVCSVEVSGGTEREFLFGVRKPLFIGMHRFRVLSETSWETVTFAFLYYYLFYFSNPFEDKFSFSLVRFYSISTIVGYLTPNPFYIYCKLAGRWRRRPEGSLFNSYYTEV